MKRLNITSEGYAEEKFVNDILRPHLIQFDVYATTRKIRTSQGYRGGYTGYGKAKFDIERWIKEDSTAWHTTFIDLYGLDDKFPGYTSGKLLPPLEKVQHMEQAFGASINFPRFIPYIQLHEFEALLFSAPQVMEEYLGLYNPLPAGCFQNIRAHYSTPEEINDSAIRAPSKRILSLCQGMYSKVDDGILLLKEIGLDTLRNECPHFNEWLNKLENLPE